MNKKDVEGGWVLLLGSRSPLWAFLPCRGVAFQRLLCMEVFMAVLSVSPVGSYSFLAAPVVVASVSFDAFSRSILVSSVCGRSFVCRVGRAEALARGVFDALRVARRSGASVRLGVRHGWSSPRADGSFWFCAVSSSPAPVAVVVAPPAPAPVAAAPAPVASSVCNSSAWAW